MLQVEVAYNIKNSVLNVLSFPSRGKNNKKCYCMCISIITRKVDKNIVREGEKENEHTIVLFCAFLHGESSVPAKNTKAHFFQLHTTSLCRQYDYYGFQDYDSCVIHLSGMVIKYRSMAREKRLRYCEGWMMVGSAWPAIMPTLLPMRSIFLMMSYCGGGKNEELKRG